MAGRLSYCPHDLRVLGLPIASPPTVVNRILTDLGSVATLAREAPAQFDRLLELGEEIAGIGRDVLGIAQRLDERVDAMLELGERLDVRAAELVSLGSEMREVGHRIESRGGEIVDSASRVVETGSELITVLPAFERALEMATPLEGAIDRFGRLVDRLPGRRSGAPARRRSLGGRSGGGRERERGGRGGCTARPNVPEERALERAQVAGEIAERRGAIAQLGPRADQPASMI